MRLAHPNSIWLVLGDFNLPKVNYEFPYDRCRTHLYDIFFDLFVDHTITQIVLSPTRNRAILDLIWSSDTAAIVEVSITAPIANSDHNTVIATLSQSHCNTPDYDHCRLFDMNHAVQVLQCADWQQVLAGKQNVDDMVSSFMQVIDLAILFTQTRKTINHKVKPKLRKYVRKLMYKKRECWKKLQNASDNDSRRNEKLQKFREARDALKKAMCKYRCNELTDLVNSKDSRKLYQYINQRIEPRARMGRLTNRDGNTVQSALDMASLLNNTFASNFLPSGLSTHGTNSYIAKASRQDSDCRINITYEDVLRVLTHVPRGAAGPDGLNSDVIRRIAPQVAKPLFTIYQYSIFYSTFPSA